MSMTPLTSCAGVALLWCTCAARASVGQELALADYSLEQLADIVVTTVSRQPEKLAAAPASVYVISGAEIARSGATSLPEALRLAPNLQVARTNAHGYAISARGFNSPLANKLLVLIDGRSVYSPLFSGVFWELQDVPMHDIERIEVVSGPGGTIWGANAVNGVINIITRSAATSHGGLAAVYGGEHEGGATVRYGARLANGAHWRGYASRQQFSNTFSEAGEASTGGMQRQQAGLRLDWEEGGRAVTVSGDLYQGKLRASDNAPRALFSGANLLGRVDTRLDGGAALRLQAWIDHSRRDQPGLGSQVLDTLDLEAQHTLGMGDHTLSWGGGYRHTRDRIENGPSLRFTPARRSLRWANLFVQDEWRLAPALRAIAGLRLEHNVYTGLELLPNLRLAWDLDERAMVWAAAARTVRAPSRVDRDLRIHGPKGQLLLEGGPDMESETARVLELGYRAQPTSALSWSATVFFADYARLAVLESAPGKPAWLGNLGQGTVRGLELWGGWQAGRGWRLHAGAVLQDADMRSGDGGPGVTRQGQGGHDPRLSWNLRSSHDLGTRLRADLALRYVARLPRLAVPGYHELDARLAWQLRPDIELALAGRNLLHPRHTEYGGAPTRQLIERTVFASAALRF